MEYSEMAQNHDLQPSPHPLNMDTTLNHTAEDRVPQIEQHPQNLSLWQAPRISMEPAEMAQNHDPQPSPHPVSMDTTLENNVEDRVSQIGQHPQNLSLWQAPGIVSKPEPAIKAKAPATRANWVNTLWADISGQLRRFAVISSDLFDGLLLKRDTITGSFILHELVSLTGFPRPSVNFVKDTNALCTA